MRNIKSFIEYLNEFILDSNGDPDYGFGKKTWHVYHASPTYGKFYVSSHSTRDEAKDKADYISQKNGGAGIVVNTTSKDDYEKMPHIHRRKQVTDVYDNTQQKNGVSKHLTKEDDDEYDLDYDHYPTIKQIKPYWFKESVDYSHQAKFIQKTAINRSEMAPYSWHVFSHDLSAGKQTDVYEGSFRERREAETYAQAGRVAHNISHSIVHKPGVFNIGVFFGLPAITKDSYIETHIHHKPVRGYKAGDRVRDFELEHFKKLADMPTIFAEPFHE